MTTIAYRDGVMASDSGAWIGGACIAWAEKLAIGPDGTLYGVSGAADECCAFLEWVRGRCNGPPPVATKDSEGNSFIVLAALPDGQCHLITGRGKEIYRPPYFAIGAGSTVAYGALFMGATARQAIEAAKEHGEGAHGPVQTIARNPAHHLPE